METGDCAAIPVLHASVTIAANNKVKQSRIPDDRQIFTPIMTGILPCPPFSLLATTPVAKQSIGFKHGGLRAERDALRKFATCVAVSPRVAPAASSAFADMLAPSIPTFTLQACKNYTGGMACKSSVKRQRDFN